MADIPFIGVCLEGWCKAATQCLLHCLSFVPDNLRWKTELQIFFKALEAILPRRCHHFYTLAARVERLQETKALDFAKASQCDAVGALVVAHSKARGSVDAHLLLNMMICRFTQQSRTAATARSTADCKDGSLTAARCAYEVQQEPA